MEPHMKTTVLTLKPNTCLAPAVGRRALVIKTHTVDPENMVIPNIVPYLTLSQTSPGFYVSAVEAF